MTEPRFCCGTCQHSTGDGDRLRCVKYTASVVKVHRTFLCAQYSEKEDE